MGRRKKRRIIQGEPGATYYKPQGIPMRSLEEAVLTHDGFEALRLADVEGLSQEDAAGMMGVSRQTFGRIVAEARSIVARALTEGWAIRIEGGHCSTAEDAERRGKGDGCTRLRAGGRRRSRPNTGE